MKGTVAYVLGVRCISHAISHHYSTAGFAGLSVQKEYETGIGFARHLLGLSMPMTVFIASNTVGADPKNILVIVASFLAANILTILFGGICLYYMGQKITAMT